MIPKTLHHITLQVCCPRSWRGEACFQRGASVTCQVFLFLMLRSVGLGSVSLKMGLCLGSRRHSTHGPKPWIGRLNRLDQFPAMDLREDEAEAVGGSALEPVLFRGQRARGHSQHSKGTARSSAVPSSASALSQHAVHRTPPPCVVTSLLRSKDRKERLTSQHKTTILNTVLEIPVIKSWPKEVPFLLMKSLRSGSQPPAAMWLPREPPHTPLGNRARECGVWEMLTRQETSSKDDRGIFVPLGR